jgi:hypothetical protein
MIRATRIELRRSNAIVLAVLLLLASALVIAASMHQWDRQWLLFSSQQAGGRLLLVPLALAGGAMLGRREARTRADELMASTGRPRWQKVTPPAVALAVAVTAVHLLTLAAGATMVGASGGLLGIAGVLPALVDITVLVGAVWLGFAAGRVWPVPGLPAALAALVLVVQVAVELTAADSSLRSLTLNLPPPGNAWESFSTAALLGRLSVGVGLLVGALLLGAGASRLLRAAGLAAVAAGLVLTVVITPLGPGALYRVDAAAQRLVCADGVPQVCVTAVYAHDLPTVTPAVRRALALLAKLPGAPARAVQWRADAASTFDPDQFRGSTPATDPGTVLFRVDPDNRVGGTGDLFRRRALDPAALTANIVNGAGTTMNGCRLGDPVALGAAGAWLLDVDVPPVTDIQFRYDDRVRADIAATVRALRRLPEPEQVRRVTALRDAAGACRTTDLRAVLLGDPAT